MPKPVKGILFAGVTLLLAGVAALLAWCIPWRTQISETQPALLFSLDNAVDTELGVATVEGVFTRQGGDCGRFRGSIRAPGLPEGPDIELSEMIFREPPYSGGALFCTEFQRIGSGQSGVRIMTEVHVIGEIYMHGRFEQPLIAFLSEELGEIYSHFLAIGVETREEAIALLECYAETAVMLRASLAETA